MKNNKKSIKQLVFVILILTFSSIVIADEFEDFEDVSNELYEEDIQTESVNKENEIEEIQRQIASEKYKKNLNTTGVLKPSNNVKNGNDGNKVIVEPRNIIPVSNSNSKMEMVPYRDRRKDWGQIWGLSYGLYQPNEYVLDQQAVTFADVDTNGIGLISFEFAIKYNLSFISAGIFTSIGYFKSELTNNITGAESELTFIPLKIGLFAEFDTLFREPYLVPYGHVGVFASKYTEESEFTSIDGTSFLAIYFSAGVMIQLDWIDNMTSRIAYQDGGIENTFLFAELNYMSSSLVDIDETAAKDPDLSSLYYSAGLKLEF